MPRADHDFSAIYPTEQPTLGLDFARALSIFAPGETIGSPVVTILVVSGSDPTPSLRRIGTPSIAGTFVLQTVGTCQVGTVYDIIATVVTSGGQTLTTNAHLPCIHQM